MNCRKSSNLCRNFGCQAKLNFIGFPTSFSQTNEKLWGNL